MAAIYVRSSRLSLEQLRPSFLYCLGLYLLTSGAYHFYIGPLAFSHVSSLRGRHLNIRKQTEFFLTNFQEEFRKVVLRSRPGPSVSLDYPWILIHFFNRITKIKAHNLVLFWTRIVWCWLWSNFSLCNTVVFANIIDTSLQHYPVNELQPKLWTLKRIN